MVNANVVSIGRSKKVSATFMGVKFETDNLVEDLLRRGAMRVYVDVVERKIKETKIRATVVNADDYSVASRARVVSLGDSTDDAIRLLVEDVLCMVNPRHLSGVEIND